MKDGKKLIELAIKNRGMRFFEIQSTSGKTVCACVDAKTPEEAMEQLDNYYEHLPPGRYTVIVGKKADEENERVLRGSKGAAAYEIGLYISNTGHIDINSHNATGIQVKEVEKFRDEIERLKMELLKKELLAANTKDKEPGIFDKIMSNPNSEHLINAAILGLTNIMSNAFIPPQQIANGQTKTN